jgi:hypothetical protein
MLDAPCVHVCVRVNVCVYVWGVYPADPTHPIHPHRPHQMYGVEHYLEWMRPEAYQNLTLQDIWQAAWRAATADASPSGVLIDAAAEAPAFLSPQYLPLASVAAREQFISRCVRAGCG